ncbi:MAG: leucyl aminopeptidase [Patescibacteria group bacterium]|jgi:leucyl aminopeptidase
MQINVLKATAGTCQANLIVIPVFGGKTFSIKNVKGIPAELVDRFMVSVERTGFAGKLYETVSLQLPVGGNADAILVIGLGEKKSSNLQAIREAVGMATGMARKNGMKSVGLILPKELSKSAIAEAAATAAILSDYSFDTYKKEASNKHLDLFVVATEERGQLLAMRKAVEHAETLCDGLTVARDLVNTPGGHMTPSLLADAAIEIAKSSNEMVDVKILEAAECEKLGMGSYLSVAKGSGQEPKFIHLIYKSPRPSKKTVTVVGKGVTFDSGGLSLKPADGMMTMKCDMAGAAAVLGFFATLSRLKPRVNIHGVIAATENMPSGHSTKPGDVVKSMNGKTIEVLNTDAEGRLTLADAMTYIQREVKPDAMIDLATLTGAVVAALGEEVAGAMGNDKKLMKEVLDASEEAGERTWELPLFERYASLVKSEVADLRNISTSRYGGALTAGLFLAEFVEDNTPWVHLDIAGPAFAERPLSTYVGKGGTGFGVGTLVKYVQNLE